MQRFGRQQVNGSKTLLRSARNHFYTTLPCITEITNCETGSYLNVQKHIFHATLRKTTCEQVANTAEISTESVSYQSSINFR